MICLPHACHGRIDLRFPGNSSHMCCVELALKGVASAVKALWDTSFPCSLTQWLCHDNEPPKGWNWHPWLPLPVWYGCAHAWGTGQSMVWCTWAPCFKLALLSLTVFFAYAIEFMSIYFFNWFFKNYCNSLHFYTNWTAWVYRYNLCFLALSNNYN